MDSTTLMNWVRSALMLVGGFVVAQGWTDNATVMAIVGGVVALVGVVWSHTHHTATQAQLRALIPPKA